MRNKNYHRTYIIGSNFIIFIKKKKKKKPHKAKNFSMKTFLFSI